MRGKEFGLTENVASGFDAARLAGAARTAASHSGLTFLAARIPSCS